MNTGQIDWDRIFLNGNPFDIIPPTDPEQVIWVGMPKLKERFNEIFEIAISSDSTQVVLNQGPYGGGKTHASLYFRCEKNLPSVSPSESRIYTIPIHIPRDSGNPDQGFYTELLDRLGMTHVREIIRGAVSNLLEAEALQSLHKVLGSEELARAFWLLGTEDASEKQALLRAYFLEGSTRTDLKKLGIARNITKAQDRFRVLAGVLQCLIGLDPSRDLSRHSRVCLWIDEMEDMIYFTSSQFRTLTQGLRDIVDRLPNFFTLFLNMSLAEPEEDKDIELLLGRAVMDRVTDVVYFPELKPDEAVQYVDELVNHPQYRDKPLPNGLPQTYPFDEIALRMLLENLEKRTPRDINKRCSKAINYAFRDNQFHQVGKGIIDPEYVMKIEKSELDQDID
ncbi:MAG: hypothetical protein OXD49_20155 [Candidatus Poribacteria bacterium]|nr:hypothetical protein [Candidatus Poribacteria bacterium]